MSTTDLPELPDDITESKFRVLGLLGQGGMAKVYLAEQSSEGIKKLVVLKVLDPQLAAFGEFRRSFRTEAQFSARLRHPNIVQVHGVYDHAQVPFMVMEYLEGLSLAQVIKGSPSLSLEARLHVLTQAMSGLHYVHELKNLDGEPLGAVHRDVSPQNIFVLFEGFVKVLDFGIAKSIDSAPDDATRTGVVKGKAKYMPPEQMMGVRDLDRRADIFSVGVMLWECLAGERFWGARTEQEIFQALANGRIPRLPESVVAEHPSVLVDAVHAATSARREDRPATMKDLLLRVEEGMRERNMLTNSRLLAEELAEKFGAQQQALKSETNAALRGEKGFGLDIQAIVDASTKRGDTGSASGVVALPSATPAPVSGSSVQTKALLILVAVLLVSFVAIFLTMTGRLRGESASASSTAPASGSSSTGSSAPASVLGTIHFTLDTEPTEAEVIVDQQKYLSPVHATLTRSTTPLTVRVAKEGHETQTLTIVPSDDVQLRLTLAASTESKPASTETPSSSPNSVGSTKPTSGTKAKKATTPAPSAAVAEKPEPTDLCTPPYRINPDGTKTFKKECL